MQPAMIRLFIVDDHSVIVDGIRHRLRHLPEVFAIAGSAENPDKFIESAPADAFDMIVLDLWFPGREPVETLQRIMRQFPGKPVVIYTQETSVYWMKVMMENGVKAYILKSADKKEFKETIEHVFSGKTLAPVLLLDGKANYAPDGLLVLDYFLKPSERSIVFAISNGESLASIAAARNSSVSAIEKTMKKIREKFRVATNPELIRLLVEQNLI